MLIDFTTVCTHRAPINLEVIRVAGMNAVKKISLTLLTLKIPNGVYTKCCKNTVLLYCANERMQPLEKTNSLKSETDYSQNYYMTLYLCSLKVVGWTYPGRPIQSTSSVCPVSVQLQSLSRFCPENDSLVK